MWPRNCQEGDVYFARGGSRDRLQHWPECVSTPKACGMERSDPAAMEVGDMRPQGGDEERRGASTLPSPRHRLMLSCGEAHQPNQPECCERPWWWALLPHVVGAASGLIHQEAPLWNN